MNQSSTKKFIIASLLCAPFFFVACGDDITEEIEKSEIKTEENGVRWARPEQQLVVTLPQTDENATRVVLVDGKYADPKSSGVKATWETTDKVGVWNSTAFADGQNGYNTVNPKSNTQHTNFVGTVNCSKGDKISLFYPYGNGTGVTTSSDGMLTLNLQSQNGTLEEISKKFDLVYGEATISSVSNGEASASLGMLTSGITILELQFQDTENENAQIEFNHLEIQVEDGHNMATLNLNNIADGLTMIGENTFDIRPDTLVTKVYVALFGETAGKTLRFSIIDKYGFQHQASAKAPTSVTAGQITRANLKAKDGKFIEFGDTKFAKGNLIWDNGSLSEAAAGNASLLRSYLEYDSYFIASSQEWSPEQLTTVQNPNAIAGMPVWPVGAYEHKSSMDPIYTVPDSGGVHYYTSTFLLCVAGLHGTTSGLGVVVTRGEGSLSGASTAVVNGSPVECIYQRTLWNDASLNQSVTLDNALKWATGESGNNKIRHFFGDLPYLVSRGQYAVPTYEELEKIFNHPNAVWAVYPLDRDGQSITVKAGSKGLGLPANSEFYNQNPDILPIYGLYVDKTRSYDDMKAKTLYTGKEWGNKSAASLASKGFAYKGCAVVLTKDDLKRGIFLPADGIRDCSGFTGKYNFITGYMPGEYCSYLCAVLGGGSLGSENGRHWSARPSNHGENGTWGNDNEPDVLVEAKKEQRTKTGSIRPVFVGDIFK